MSFAKTAYFKLMAKHAKKQIAKKQKQFISVCYCI